MDNTQINSEEGKDPSQMKVDMEQVEHALNNINIQDITNKIVNDREGISKLVEDSMDKVTPEMIQKANKMAKGGQGQQMVKMMQKKGLEPQAMRDQFIQQQKMMKKAAEKNLGDTKKVIHITSGKQVKSKNIHVNSVKNDIAKIIGCDEPTELPCSRLAKGSLDGKTIKLWYDSNRKGKNPRGSRIAGFEIAGEIIIIMDEGNIEQEDFIAVEKSLR